MTSEAVIVFAVLVGALALFVWGRWRYDVVALIALLGVTVTGVVSPDSAFTGFGHPAVVTVAAVLVVSRGLVNAGLTDRISKWIAFVGSRPTFQIAGLLVPVIVLSGFLSSVAAAALFMPVALRMSRRTGTSPSVLLMPIAFGSLLGAQLTAIGSAPNIIIAAFRAESGGASPFRMFDFLPVGGSVAIAGVVFIAILGWRLIPKRQRRASREDALELTDYVTEVRVVDDSRLVGKTTTELEEMGGGDVTLVGRVSGRRRRLVPLPADREFVAGDVIVIETDPETMASFVADSGLELVGVGDPEDQLSAEEEFDLMEVSLSPGSALVGKTARSVQLRWRHGVNLLAVSRAGSRPSGRLHRSRLQAGDVLLLQGPSDSLNEAASQLQLLPLAERDLRIGKPRRLIASLSIFGAAVAVTATGAVRVEIAFVVAAIVMIVTGLLTLEEAYGNIDPSIIILLGAMIPVGGALETSGGAQLIADGIIGLAAGAPPAVTVGVVLVGTMFLSDLVNNAAAAVLMAPVAFGIAEGTGASADPFLMAVAVGASCAFLTPIGHQSNTLVLGPGGYRFGDYWRLGLPLEICVVAVAVPMILRVWPL